MKTIPGTILCAIGVGSCGLAPNPAYQPGAMFTRELAGNYMHIASCSYDNLQKIARPVQKADFPERQMTRLSRFTDGTIMQVFQIDFIGQGPNVTKVAISEPMTIGAMQPTSLMAYILPCARAR